MRLTRTRIIGDQKPDLSIAPLIDVVFLLLIFFLVTTTFVTPERELQPAIVVEHQAAGASPVRLEPLSIELVRRDGQAVFQVGATWSADLSVVQPIIDGYPDKESGAWVRLSDDVPFDLAAQAVNACRQAGFDAVSLVPFRDNR